MPIALALAEDKDATPWPSSNWWMKTARYEDNEVEATMGARYESMATSPLNLVIQQLLADFGPDGPGMTDGELLARFLSSRDDNALAALVHRHAAMVWGVCGRLLRSHDAEDAFQATFLVLVRKAADIPRQAVANWLYGVARQTAVRLRALTAKRGRRETQVMNMPEPTAAEVRDADLKSVLDDELGRLPDHYRGVIVLCDLEGMTRKQAARQLGIPEGSVSSRLARARVMLGKRLGQRGVVVSGGSVAAVLSAGAASASAPPALMASTIQAASLLAAGRAAGVISAKVTALTEGVVKAMFATKIKNVLAVVLVVALVVGAAGLIYQAQAAGQPASPTSERAAISTTPNQAVREAATRAVRLIDRASAHFVTTRTCFTCHTQTLSAMVLRDARKVGIEINEANFKRQYQRAIEDMTGTRVDTKGHMLWALDIGQYAPDDKTEATVEYILNIQKHDGKWTTTVDRPPTEASHFTTNYVALRGLNRYGTAKQREAIATRATAVRQWLESANAVDTQDQVFRLRLAHELKLPSDKVDHYVQRLLREQEADGGWAQNRQMKPDAYATGSVLVALHEAGGLSCQHPAWQRGLGYLLRTQKPDGSWHVVSRAKPIMEYFESGFPHGKDQFISTFATGWATEALLMSLAEKPKDAGQQPAQAKQQPAQSDQERIEGNWVITNDDSKRKGEMWVISEKNIIMGANSGRLRANLYLHRLDAGKDPKQIDINVILFDGPPIGVIKGIYVLDGDELRLCLGELGKDRPAAFAEKPGQGEVLILQRQNPAAGQRKAKEEQPGEQSKFDVVGAGETAIELVTKAKDPDAKWMAIRILGNLRYERAVPLLLESLSDPHHYVRANAARALGDMKVAAAAKPLTELLGNEMDGGVIQQTSLALGNLGCADAVPALKGAAKHEDVQTRMWVLQAVGRLGGKRDVPFLAGYLDDPSQSVQASAAQAIEQLTGADFGFPMRSGPSSPDEGLRRAKAWWAEHKGEYEHP